jgi:hypothetical protein
MELEYSLTCPRESTTCLWPEPDDNFSTTPSFFMSTLGSISVLSYCLQLSSKQYLSFRFPCQSLVYVSLLYTFCPAWSDHSNNTHWGVLIMKLLKTELFSSPLVHHPTLSQVFSSAPCSWTLSVCVLSLSWEINFHTIQNNRKVSNSVYFNSYVSHEQTGRQNILNWQVANIPQIKSALKFFMTAIFIC